MKLKKVTSNDPVSRVPLTFHESTLRMLKHYQQMYQDTYGDTITQSHMVEELLKDAFASDKAFQKYLTTVPAVPAVPAVPSATTDIDRGLAGVGGITQSSQAGHAFGSND
jgi:hypothetical protein